MLDQTGSSGKQTELFIVCVNTIFAHSNIANHSVSARPPPASQPAYLCLERRDANLARPAKLAQFPADCLLAPGQPASQQRNTFLPPGVYFNPPLAN